MNLDLPSFQIQTFTAQNFPVSTENAFLMFDMRYFNRRVSLVAQWQRIRLQMQETQVQSLIQEDPPGEGNGNPLQCSCLGHPVDKGAWRDTVRGVAESLTWLSD